MGLRGVVRSSFHIYINAGVPEWHRERSKKPCSGGSSPLTRTRSYIVSPKEQNKDSELAGTPAAI